MKKNMNPVFSVEKPRISKTLKAIDTILIAQFGELISLVDSAKKQVVSFSNE
ncbi:hypothetical protein ULM_25000 [Legionella pneumophila]|nr:hypothetical protein [Legionella pneumophila]AMV15161.1 hypothetical protein ULM_25000 [Legionella pneumophila]